jgi:hypothetical protein
MINNKFGCLTKDGKKDLQKLNESKDKKKCEKRDFREKTEKKKEHKKEEIKKEEFKKEESKKEEDNRFVSENILGKIQKLQQVQHQHQHQHENDTENIDYGDNLFLNTQYTVWVHRNDCNDWTESSYKSVYVIDSIGTFWKFFNNFHMLNKEENQFFIMKDKIKPIWEDNNNRIGGCYSMKLDCYDKNGKDDLASEVMISLCILIMNESLVPENGMINGISYSIKNRSVLIKIWTRNFNYNMEEKFPKGLLSKFNNIVKNRVLYKKNDIVVAARYTPIKPEYEIK